MPSLHIMKPMTDILSDYIDALIVASSDERPWKTSMKEMCEAADKASLELRASWGLSDAKIHAMLCLATVSAMGKVHKEDHSDSYAASAANFV